MASYNSGFHGNIYKILCSWKNNDVEAFNYTLDKARYNVMEFCLSSCNDNGGKQMTFSEIVQQSFVLNLIDDTCRSILRFLIGVFFSKSILKIKHYYNLLSLCL